MTEKIYIVGPTGSRRALLGEKVAKERGLDLLFLDKEIEKEDGRTIKKIAMMMGEHAYHDKEYHKLVELDEANGSFVLVCGDGVLFDNMCEAIVAKGEVIVADWDRSPTQLFEEAVLDETLPYAYLDMLRMEERIAMAVSPKAREKAYGTFEKFYNERRKYFMKYAETVKPTLLVMAAGMGSRYGGLKQIDPVTDEGEIILDFSLFDAKRAGFEDVVFVIRKETEQDFRDIFDEKIGKQLNITYAFQEINDLPEGFSVPEGRAKPWGTGHAILSARNIIKGPFAVINADDYYGAEAFETMYNFLAKAKDEDYYDFCMVGYDLKNTLTENGYVSRGVCKVSKDGMLIDIVERTHIENKEQGPAFTEDEGETWEPLSDEDVVSMNLWGYTNSMMQELKEEFPIFLEEAMKNNPLKGEYLIPKVTDALIKEGKAKVKVLSSKDRWYGVTYKEDKEIVSKGLKSLKETGLYPSKLWE